MNFLMDRFILAFEKGFAEVDNYRESFSCALYEFYYLYDVNI